MEFKVTYFITYFITLFEYYDGGQERSIHRDGVKPIPDSLYFQAD